MKVSRCLCISIRSILLFILFFHIVTTLIPSAVITVSSSTYLAPIVGILNSHNNNRHLPHKNNYNNRIHRIMSLRPSQQRQEKIVGTNHSSNTKYHSKNQPSSSTTALSSSSSLLTINPFYLSSNVYILTNLLGFIITLFKPKLHYHVDILGTGAFAIATLIPLLLIQHAKTVMVNQRILISSLAVISWSIKLASFLLYRVLKLGHDQRLTEILSIPSSAFGFWFISTLWGIICSLPHTMGLLEPNITGTTTSLYFGTATFIAGWCIETLADIQKWKFKQSSSEFCNVGLWSISQHPNWMGNLILWMGIFIINSPTYIDPISAIRNTNSNIFSKGASFLYRSRRLLLALCGPIFMLGLFYSQATGVILNDTIQANYKKYGYGTNIEYTNYIDETSLLFPNVPKLIVQWIRQSK